MSTLEINQNPPEIQQIELDLLRLFQSRILLASHSAIGSVMTIGFFVWWIAYQQSQVNTIAIHIYIVLTYSIGYVIHWWFHKNPPQASQLKQWHWIFKIYALACGVCLGFTVALMCWYNHGIVIALAVSILLCVSSIGLGLNMSQLHAMWLFNIACMLPSILILLSRSTYGEVLAGTLLLLGLVFQIVFGGSMHKTLYMQLRRTVELRSTMQEAQLARQQADQANSFKSQFLANVSHEIRTPMHAVLGMLKLLQYTDMDEQQWDYTLKGESAAQAMLHLINNILDFSKIEAGKVVLETQPLHLYTFMQEIMQQLENYAKEKPIDLQLYLDKTLPPVLLCDGLRLRQILLNLGNNAIKFTERGVVSLHIEALAQDTDSATLRFEVRDSGIGIAPEKQSQIFEEFTQAENSTTKRYSGTGLGLSISKKLVQTMGGSIQLESALNQGSTFTFELKLIIFDANATRSEGNTNTPPI